MSKRETRLCTGLMVVDIEVSTERADGYRERAREARAKAATMRDRNARDAMMKAWDQLAALEDEEARGDRPCTS
jgi:hypothetical protein